MKYKLLRKKANNEFYLLFSGQERLCKFLLGSSLRKEINDAREAALKDVPELKKLCPLKVTFNHLTNFKIIIW
jgi:hypothetical protein